MSRETTDKNQQYFYEEDEIDLYEIWLLLKKRKILILITTLIFLTLGVIYILVSANIYRDSAVVALPSVDFPTTKTFVDFPTTKEIIDSLNKKVEKKEVKSLPRSLRNSFLRAQVRSIVANSVGKRGGKEVFILKVEGLNKSLLPSVVDSIINYLNSNKYVKCKVEEQKFLIKKQIDLIKREIPKIEKEASAFKQKLLNSNQAKIVGFNPTDIDRSIIELKTRIMNLRYILSSGIHGYSVIYSDLTQKPVKPKRKLIIVVSSISGLFFGIFLAFFLEWLENARKRFSGAPQR